MKKHIAILNGETVQEIENPNINFEELIERMGQNATQGTNINVLSENGKTKPANLKNKITDYFETRNLNVGGVPAKYNCLEIELKQKLDFWQYCKNTSCLIIDKQIFDINDKREKNIGKLKLFGETFYITEKNPNFEIEIDETTLHDLMVRNYFNYRGSLYELDKGKGEIELKGRNYTISNRKRGKRTELTNPEIFSALENPNIKSYEIRYKETKEIIIRRKYKK
ncbi:MAG: hypothetical protein V1914_04340 [archaeon]